MSIVLKVPSIGESITEVIVGDWFKSEGEFVRLDENVVVVESDKANFEVPSPVEGKVVKVLKQTGETAAIGETIAELEECEVPKEEVKVPAAAPEPAPQVAEPAPAPAVESTPAPVVDATPEPDGSDAVNAPVVMPAAARLLAEHGLTAAGIKGTGRGGRILKEDVKRFIAGQSPAPISTPKAEPAVAKKAPVSAPAKTSTGARPERRGRPTGRACARPRR